MVFGCRDLLVFHQRMGDLENAVYFGNHLVGGLPCDFVGVDFELEIHPPQSASQEKQSKKDDRRREYCCQVLAASNCHSD